MPYLIALLTVVVAVLPTLRRSRQHVGGFGQARRAIGDAAAHSRDYEVAQELTDRLVLRREFRLVGADMKTRRRPARRTKATKARRTGHLPLVQVSSGGQGRAA
jgi:hypothetical protein